jgi:hypothetical protein
LLRGTKTPRYYAGWDTYPQDFGIVSVDLANYTSTWLPTDNLVHDLACHPTDPSKLLAVLSTPTAATAGDDGSRDINDNINNNSFTTASSASFGLYTVDGKSGDVAKVGDFPDLKPEVWEGFDTTFRITADGATAVMTIGKVQLPPEHGGP